MCYLYKLLAFISPVAVLVYIMGCYKPKEFVFGPFVLSELHHLSTRWSGANTTKAPRVKIIDFGMVLWQICWGEMPPCLCELILNMTLHVIYSHSHTHTYIYIYTHTIIHVYLCVYIYIYTHQMIIHVWFLQLHASWIYGINRIHTHAYTYTL